MKVTIEAPKPVVTPPPTVTLELSLEEAAVVKAAVGSFTDNDTYPFGGVCLDVWTGLDDAGVDPGDKVYFFYVVSSEIKKNLRSPIPEVEFPDSH